MRAVEVPEPGADFELVERDRPDPGPNEVRIEVAACGVGGGDTAVTEGRPPIDYPRIPGHEIAGTVDAVGDDVETWAPGDRVAVGWHGGHCFTCDPCRRGDFVNCEHERVTGLLGDGGFAEYATAPREALIEVPEGLSLVHAAPMTCAGLTAFNALRNADVRPGDRVAIVGVGGVGHLGVQFADALGFETVAVSRGTDKREAARQLGADVFVDAAESDPAERLAELGGADAVLATAPSAEAMASVVGGLAVDGELVAVGAPDEPMELPATRLFGRQSVSGWSAGTSPDAEDAMRTAVREGVEPWVETHPLSDADVAFERMLAGEARFRGVLEP